MIKTLIFDLGNVIVRFDHGRIVRRVEQFCDLSGSEIFERMFGSDIVHDYDHGKTSSVEFFDRVRKYLNLRMTFDEFSEAWNSTFDLNPILPEEMFESLSQKYRLLILSDTNELHFEFIKQNFSLLSYFDDFVVSYRVGAIKPAPEIFLAAVEKANCLPAECFFIDDREPNVEGARKIGIRAELFISAEQFAKDLRMLE